MLMEPELGTPSPFSFLKIHPIIPVCLTLSVAAIALGIISVSRTSHVPSSQDGFTPVDNVPHLANPTLSVDVEGQVTHPGVVTLEVDPGKPPRIADVLRSVGGLLDTADQDYVEKNMNLAAVVTDGMKLYVPAKGEKTPTVGGSSGNRVAVINVNTASLRELQSLKGIGEARAQIIVDNRPYVSLEDIATRTKLPMSLLEKVKNDIGF